ncbi:MAG: hypothetical protein L0H83_15650, partial [Salinisphaera sp.]|nr:hypothetical protein [Salinisphaera sp.]
LIGIDLGADDTDGPNAVPPRMWVGAVTSTRAAQEFFAARGVASEIGRTTLEFRGDAVVGLTSVDDVPLIRVVATVGAPTVVEAGDRIYVRATHRGVVEVAHPWIAMLTDGWTLTSLEFTGTTGVFDGNAIIGECFERGLIMETTGQGDSVVKVMPPLISTDADLDEGLDIIGEAIHTVAGAGATGVG